MDGDRLRRELVRLALAGDRGLSPVVGGRPGRFSDIRLLWLIRTGIALRDADATRLAAIAFASAGDIRGTNERLKQAHLLMEPNGAGTGPTDAELKAAWGQYAGVDYDTPEGRDKVYAAVAEMRRQRIEGETKAAMAEQRRSQPRGRRRGRPIR